MKKVRKLSLSAIAVSLLMVLNCNASASTYLGTLSNWNSNQYSIGVWASAPRIYTENLSSNTSFNLDYYVGNGMYNWASTVSCSKTSTQSLGNILYYGGTRAQIQSLGIFSSLTSDTMGYTIIKNGDYYNKGYYTYSSSTINCDIYTKAYCCLIEKSRTDSNYMKTATHELGHALGYEGHSPTSGEIMYESSYLNTTGTLTNKEKNHLKQVQ